MNVIVCGGRDYEPCPQDWARLGYQLAVLGAKCVFSGRASGADKLGEQVAIATGLSLKKFPADWDQHGRAAGPIRNRQMAEEADAVVAFPGGRGTKNMIEIAESMGLTVKKL